MSFARNPWRIVPLLAMLVFLGHFNRIAMSVAGSERIMQEYSIDPSRMGTIYSAFLLTYTLSMTPVGMLADRFGPWLILGLAAFGLGLGSLATGGVGFAISGAGLVAALLGVRAVMGSLSSPLHPSTARLVANWMPPAHRVLANGLTLSAAMLGIALTYYVFGALMDRFDWPVAFMITGGVTLAAGVIWYGLGGDAPNARRAVARAGAPPMAGWATLLRNRSLVFVALAYGALGYFEFLFFYWMQYYFGTVLDLGDATSRLYSTIVTLAMAAGVISGGWITDGLIARLGRQRGLAAVPVVGMALGALFLWLGVAAETPAWIVAWFSLGAFTSTAAEAASWVTVVDLGRERGTTAGGIMNTGGNIGGFVAPILTPWLGTQLGWHWAVGVGAAVSLAGALLWLGVRVPSQQASGQ